MQSGRVPTTIPRHLGQFESLREDLPQPLQRSIRIRKRLEIGQIPFGRTIATAMELDPFLELSADALVRSAVGRRESRVVAERATARGERAVAIGTSEPGMHGQLLHAKAEQTAEIAGIAVIAPVVAPRISHRLEEIPAGPESLLFQRLDKSRELRPKVLGLQPQLAACASREGLSLSMSAR